MIFTWGKENFLKEAFLPPTPPSFQELSKGNIVLFYIVRSTAISAVDFFTIDIYNP